MATTELRRPLFGSSAPAGFPSDRASDTMVSIRERTSSTFSTPSGTPSLVRTAGTHTGSSHVGAIANW